MPGRSSDDDRHLTLTEKQGVVRLKLTIKSIDGESLRALEAALSQIEIAAGNGEIRGLILMGSPTGLPGGPDPALILDAESQENLVELAARGSEISRRLERLPIPVVAILEGAALDAGFEFALAAHVRIGKTGPGLRVGLPGLDPALPPLFGGLSRLLEIAGLKAGLDIVLERKRLSGRQAEERGLIAELVDGAHLERSAEAQIEKLAESWRSGHQGNPSHRRVGISDYLSEEFSLFRRFELGRYRRRIETMERPAALCRHLLDSVELGASLPRFERLERESRNAAELAHAQDTRRRLSIVKRSNDLVRGGPYAPAGAAITMPRRVAILGAGHVGTRLALALLGRGLQVRLFDPFPEALVAAKRRIDDAIDDLVQRRRLKKDAAPRVRDRLLIAPEPRSMTDLDLIIECVPEVLALKREVLRQAIELSGPEALIVSHSASLSPGELRRGLPGDRRIQVMHMLIPEATDGLCEIVRDRDSQHQDLAILARVARELGRFPLISSGPAPFAAGRLLTLFISEALRLFGEGWSPRTIDGAARDFGFTMGPLERLDLIGVDVVLAMARRLEEDSQSGFHSPPILSQLVERSETGKRRGLGIRAWGERGPQPRNESELRRVTQLGPTLMEQDRRLIRARLIDPLVFAGQRALDEKVISSSDELDLLSVYGLGFPASRGGLATYIAEAQS